MSEKRERLSDEAVEKMLEEMNKGISALEIFKDDDGKIRQYHIDQLYNLPSYISSDANLELILNRNGFNMLNHMDLAIIHGAAIRQQIMTMVNMLSSAIYSNLVRYLDCESIVIRTLGSKNIIPAIANKFCNTAVIPSQNPVFPLTVTAIITNYLMGPYEYNLPLHSPLIAEKVGYDPMINRTKQMQAMLCNSLYQFCSGAICFIADEIIQDKFNGIMYYCENGQQAMRDLADRFHIAFPEQYKMLINNENQKLNHYNLVCMVKQLFSFELLKFFENYLVHIISNIVDNCQMTNYYIPRELADVKEEMMHERMEKRQAQEEQVNVEEEPVREPMRLIGFIPSK